MSKIFPNRNRWKRWTLPSKIGYIGFWIALFGLPAILFTYSSIFIKYIDRTPEIIEIKPFVYINKRKDLKFRDFPAPTELGLFFIVHIKNGSKVSTINGLNIRVSKFYLDYNEYFILTANSDKVKSDIEKEREEKKKEWKEKRPYISIDWDTYISDKNIKRVLFPYDDAYIGFTLLDPRISGSVEEGWLLPIDKYFGYENENKIPEKVRKYPDFYHIFSDFNVNKLPPRKIRDVFEFYLLINDKEILIDKDLIKSVGKIYKFQYDKDSFEKMLLRYQVE